MNREEKRILGLTVSAHGLVHLFEGVLPPLIPLLIVTFDTDYFHLGVIVTLFSYTFGLGSLPAGFFADRIGPRRFVTFYLLSAGLLSVAILGINSFWPYGILMGLLGLFCSVYHPASNTLIAEAIREKGKGFGIHGIAGSMGVACAPLLSAWFGTLLGWKAPHLIFGLMAIVAGVFSVNILRQPKSIRRHIALRGEEPKPERLPYLQLIVFFCSAVSLGLTYKGIMTFLPAYMGERVQVAFFDMGTVALGGTIATITLLSGALGQYLAGRLVDRFRPEKLYLGAILLGTFFVFLMAVAHNTFLVGSAVLYAFFYFSTQPIQNFMLAKYLPKNRLGLGYGVHFSLTFGVGSTAAAVCGYLADRFGLASVFYAMGLCFVLASCLAGLLLLRGSRRSGTSP